MFGPSFQVVSIVPSGLMTHVPLVVDGNASASSAYRAPFSSVFCSLLAGMFCAWTAPPDVLALAERLMTKPFGSRVSAMRIVFGPVEAGADGCPLAPGAPGAGVQAASTRLRPTRASNTGRGA